MTLEPIRVLVSDFVPAPFHVSAELRARQATPNARLEAHLHATLHGGGPFANAKARITARVQAASFNVPEPPAKRSSLDPWQQGGRDRAPMLHVQATHAAQGEWEPTLQGVHGSAVVRRRGSQNPTTH